MIPNMIASIHTMSLNGLMFFVMQVLIRPITPNTSRNMQRRYQELQESGFEPGVEASFDSESEAEDLGKLINNFLKTCKKEKVNIFVLRYFHNKPLSEICDVTGFSESKVKTVLMRMRNDLREYLAKEGYGS